MCGGQASHLGKLLDSVFTSAGHYSWQDYIYESCVFVMQKAEDYPHGCGVAGVGGILFLFVEGDHVCWCCACFEFLAVGQIAECTLVRHNNIPPLLKQPHPHAI